jgi:hypothetical protein
MGMLYGAQVQTMMPKLHSTNFEGMELIRPMYLIREEDIIIGEITMTCSLFSVPAALQIPVQPVKVMEVQFQNGQRSRISFDS